MRELKESRCVAIIRSVALNIIASIFFLCRIDVRTTVERVALLFNGRPSLILGFNLFLPVGYEIKNELGTNFITLTTPGGRTIDLS
jgi:histone deacetylase complex regulatory component SIN3